MSWLKEMDFTQQTVGLKSLATARALGGWDYNIILALILALTSEQIITSNTRL
jgi:hypothetical protein